MSISASHLSSTIASNMSDLSDPGWFALLDALPFPVLEINSSGNLRFANKSMLGLTGFNLSEIENKPVQMLFIQFTDKRLTRAEMPSRPKQRTCKRKDGSSISCDVMFSSMESNDGSDVRQLCIVNALSPDERFDELMIRFDRQTTCGEMAGEIAHEINNFLAILSGNIELIPLMIKREQFEKLAQKTEVMKTAIDKIAMFCDGLMTGGSDELNVAATDLNQLCLNLIAFVSPQNRFDGVTIETRLSSELPLVELDRTWIQQSLISLLNNAADSIATLTGEKKITLTTSLNRAGEGTVVMEVADNGAGVPSKHMSDMFANRFTTKPNGRGIGLMSCGRIIDKHSGTLRYHYDGGARFTIELPVSRPDQKITQPAIS